MEQLANTEQEDIFKQHPDYTRMQLHKNLSKKMDVTNPFFTAADGVASSTININERQYINFSSYNYINLNGHPKVMDAAKNAIDNCGTSVSASRIVGGERHITLKLEQEISRCLQVEDCVVFVSGHATNVSTISYLMHNPESDLLLTNNNLILYDALSHNSIVQGAKLSGANMCRFRHNDMAHLEKLIADNCEKYERILIIAEGLYSMDGDIAPLPSLVRIKKQYKAMLMIDEAHSFGVLGKKGYGIVEHYNLNPNDIDIYMGTLSKSLAGCGGYIAGKKSLVELLKHHAAGFVFSVGLAPPLVAASLKAIEVMQNEPWRIQQLHNNSEYFLKLARAANFDVGACEGFAIVPIIIPNALDVVKIVNKLFAQNIYVQPMIYPAVKRNQSRLRFFISSAHTKEQIKKTIEILQSIITEIKQVHKAC